MKTSVTLSALALAFSTLAVNAQDLSYTAYPANGSTQILADIGTTDVAVNFSFTQVNDISVTPAIEGATITVEANQSPIPLATSSDAGYTIAGSGIGSLTITIPRTFITDGTVLTIDAMQGAFTCGDRPSPAISYSITYKAPVIINAVLSPESGSTIGTTPTFTITYPDAKQLEFSDTATDTSANMMDEETADFYQSNSITGNGNVVTVSFQNALPEGDYIFTFAPGLVLVDGKDSPAVSGHFTVSQSSDVQIEILQSSSVEYYDLNGRRLNQPAEHGLVIVRKGGESNLMLR